MNKSEYDGRIITVEFSKRNRPHKSTPGAYLGPNLANSFKQSYSNDRQRRYKSRSRSRSFRRDYHRRREYIYFKLAPKIDPIVEEESRND